MEPFIFRQIIKNNYQSKEQFSSQNNPTNIISQVNRSPASSGRRTAGSYDPNFGRSSSSRSWEASLGSADISGATPSYSSGIVNDGNRLLSDYRNYSTSNHLNRDDTSPLGGPSTSEDINLVPTCSGEDNPNSYENKSIQDRKQRLGLQSNVSKFQLSNSRKSDRSISNTTTSGSFSLQEEELSVENGKKASKIASELTQSSSKSYPHNQGRIYPHMVVLYPLPLRFLPTQFFLKKLHLIL